MPYNQDGSKGKGGKVEHWTIGKGGGKRASAQLGQPSFNGASPFADAWNASIVAGDIDAAAALLHDDWVFHMHSSGKDVNKTAWKEMFGGIIKKMDANSWAHRVIYENAEISVAHSFVLFPSGDVEGVLMSQLLRDGKCYRSETGSTTIPSTSPNFTNPK